jgi:hypothetical protein
LPPSNRSRTPARVVPAPVGFAAAAAPPGPKPPTRTKGRVDAYTHDGQIVNKFEALSEWRGLQKYVSANQMVRTDPVCRAAILMLILPIVEASWSVSPATPAPEHLEHAELTRRALFEHLDWPRFLWDLLMPGLKSGHAVSEVVYEAVTWGLAVDVDGETIEQPERVYWVPRKFAPRPPETIWRWNVDDDDELTSVTQVLYIRGQGTTEVDLDVGDLVVFVNEGEGGTYEGTPVLRSAYRAWYMKEKLEVIDAIAKERAGVGVPVAYVGDKADWDGEAERLEGILAGLRAHEEGYVVTRGPKGGENGVEIEMLDMGAAGTADVLASLNYHVTQILWAVLGAWQQLGQGEVGARATATVQDDPFYLAIRALAGTVQSVIQRQVVPRLVGFNYITDKYPCVEVGDIQGLDLALFADALSKLIASQAVTPDDPLEAHVRRIMGLPERLMEEEGEGEEEEPVGEPLPPEEEPPPGGAPEGGEEEEVVEPGPGTPEGGAAEGDEEKPVAVRDHTRGGRAVRKYQRAKPARRERPGGRLLMDAADSALVIPETGRKLWRPLTEHEALFTMAGRVDLTIEQMRDRFVDLCNEAAGQAVTFLAGQATQLQEAEEIPMPPDVIVSALTDRIAEVLEQTAAWGRVSVRAEIANQRGAGRAPTLTAFVDGGGTMELATLELAARPPRDPDELRKWVTARAGIASRAILGRLRGAAERVQGRPEGGTRDLAEARLIAAARTALRTEAVQTVAMALAAGRRAETVDAFADGRVSHAEYSSVLDSGTCDACRSLDGETYEVGSDDYERDYPPLYACAGDEACRCMMVLVAADEV